MERHRQLLASAMLFALALLEPALAADEIRIGQTVPYSGPASIYGTIGKAEAAYFRMVNDQGGMLGRSALLRPHRRAGNAASLRYGQLRVPRRTAR